MNYSKTTKKGFSLAEALITLLIVCLITLASIPILTKKIRQKKYEEHGLYACYWNGNTLVAKSMINNDLVDGSVIYDNEEGRYGCVFNPPPNAKNFVATIIGGGGGGAGAGARATVHKNYTEPGEYSFITPEAGNYEFLVVGGGGGGGWRDGDLANRGGAGAYGEVVHVNAVTLAKDTQIKIKVGSGGAGAGGSSSTGVAGDYSQIKREDASFKNNFDVVAAGGGGGVSYNYGGIRMGCFSRRGSIIGYNYSGSTRQYNFGCNDGEIQVSPDVNASGGFGYYLSLTYSAPMTGISKLGGAYGSIAKSYPVGAVSSKSQMEYKYNNNSTLNSYKDKFGIDFNQEIRTSEKNCANIITCRTMCNETLWQKFAYCKEYQNNYGAGGGGRGKYGNSDYRSYAASGKNGLVAIVYKPVYAGLGGQAGKVLQIAYSEMPQRTLLFPGKGGQGGDVAPSIRKILSHYKNNTQTAGLDGQSSYIKNGAEVVGGAGALKIDPANEESYSQTINSNSMPVGGNGALSDVLTAKKTGTGGLGGLQDGNNSLNGLTQSVFKDNSQLGSFNRIYGAGSGGGGGAANVSGGSSLSLGRGGNGSSGLVFIQW
ncbi:MAG: hypothetical protein KHX03_04550 [Clostridium sp.]|nr:hypothetical protein [Clostridium sp.]